MASENSQLLSLAELDDCHRKALALKECINHIRLVMEFDSTDKAALEQCDDLHERLLTTQKTYSHGILRLFCDKFYNTLPRELRVMVYDYMNFPKGKGHGTDSSPSTQCNINHYGRDVVYELTECYYRHHEVSVYIYDPPIIQRGFEQNNIGIVPAEISRTICIMLRKLPSVYQAGGEKAAQSQCFTLLQQLKTRNKNFQLKFVLNASISHTIEGFIDSIRDYFLVLHSLHQKGVKVFIVIESRRLGKRRKLPSFNEYTDQTRYSKWTYTMSSDGFTDFEARTKQVFYVALQFHVVERR
ncbi:hypothetical protein EK21DRAFT_91790 [Setomelanomma holmii]|uniref:Uncharacterized protein n=1 Tax=Setomelanomma holmii TaxID=210430 RepID=A0A9P4LJD6_9PLEO|nr:hypothetical protein EK21DRAFT_91790 [Setomelanomma holmii]